MYLNHRATVVGPVLLLGLFISTARADVQYPSGTQTFETMNVGDDVNTVGAWFTVNTSAPPGLFTVLAADDVLGIQTTRGSSTRWLRIDDQDSGPVQNRFYSTPVVAPTEHNYTWSYYVNLETTPPGGTDTKPKLTIQHNTTTGFSNAWGIEFTSTGANLIVLATGGTPASSPLYSLASPTGIGDWVKLTLTVNFVANTVSASVNGGASVSLPINLSGTADKKIYRLCYRGEGSGNIQRMLLDDVTLETSVTGACCDYRVPGKRCIDDVLEADCPGPGREWKNNERCADNPCGPLHCGPGPHWIDNCPGGIDYLDDTQVLAAIDLNLDPCCLGDTVLTLNGSVVINRSGAQDDSTNYPGTRPIDGHLDVIDTEIVSMTLTGGGMTMTIGAGLSPGGQPLAPSRGVIAERVGDPTLGDSYFDVFFTIDLGGGTFVYNQTPVRAEAVLVKVPPKQVNYVHLVQCVPLYTGVVPGTGIHVANLSEAAHCVGGGCPPDLFKGACCDHEQPGGVCTDNVVRDGCCGDQKDFTQGATCADVDCPEHTGACCDGTTGTCTNGILPGNCVGTPQNQLTWYKDLDCDQLDPPCEEHTGACCDADPFGTCQDNVPASQCNCTKCLFYEDTPCSEIECTHNAIPTVSEWGLVVMALLLLIGAKIYFARRQTATAP